MTRKIGPLSRSISKTLKTMFDYLLEDEGHVDRHGFHVRVGNAGRSKTIYVEVMMFFSLHHVRWFQVKPYHLKLLYV